MYPAIFLDRDGVIIKNRSDYVRSWSQVEIYPQALEALATLRNSPYKIVIVTNQSVVGRGIISIQDAWEINDRLVAEIERSGGRVDKVYMCPHAPWEGCDCRKPMPGMFREAAGVLSIDLHESIMIGDALTDLVAAEAAGVDKLALVLTGRGKEQLNISATAPIKRYFVYEDLADAIRKLLKSQ